MEIDREVHSTGMHIVTGAASGIGLATAHLIKANGGAVIGLDRQPAPDKDLAQQWIIADITIADQIRQVGEQLAGLNIDHLVLCAGVAGVGSIDHVLDVNFVGTRRLLHQIAPLVRDDGAITVVSSAAGWRWEDRKSALVEIIDEPDDSKAIAMARVLCADPAEAYVRSKELLCGMVARRCRQYWGRRVRLNSVSPGGVDTPLMTAFASSMGAEAMSFALGVTGRHATADEVAEVIMFLGEDRARWINGSDLRVDGGLVGALASGTASFEPWN